MTAATRVLYVGLDACDRDLALRLVGEGRMPVLAGLLETSASVPTLAPAGFFVSSHWPTLATSRRADRLNYHCWLAHRGGTYDVELTTPHEITGTPLWDVLSGRDHRIAVFDVPHTVASPHIRGAHIVEWGCHDRHLGPHSNPPGLVAELDERFGTHLVGTSDPPGFDQFAPCDYRWRDGAHRTHDESARLLDDLRESRSRKGRASTWLLDRGDWSLFLTVLGEAHCTGHHFWATHDPSHHLHDAALARRLGDPLEEVYEALDATLGAHIEAAGDVEGLYVHLSHGMGPKHDGTALLDQALWRIDQVTSGSHRPGWRTRAGRRALGALPPGAHRHATRAGAAVVRRRSAAAPPPVLPTEVGVPRSARRWFDSPNNTVVGGVRFNVEDREPLGVLRPGPDLDHARDLVIGHLLELVNVDTGTPVVRAVTVTDDVYERTPHDSLPDLLVDWERSDHITTAFSPSLGVIHVPHDHFRSGDHHRGGLLLARGRGIRPGRRDLPAHTLDLGPTLCAALGETMPDADGSPRLDLVPG